MVLEQVVDLEKDYTSKQTTVPFSLPEQSLTSHSSWSSILSCSISSSVLSLMPSLTRDSLLKTKLMRLMVNALFVDFQNLSLISRIFHGNYMFTASITFTRIWHLFSMFKTNQWRNAQVLKNTSRVGSEKSKLTSIHSLDVLRSEEVKKWSNED